jgi:hypothetical protein
LVLLTPFAGTEAGATGLTGLLAGKGYSTSSGWMKKIFWVRGFPCALCPGPQFLFTYNFVSFFTAPYQP